MKFGEELAAARKRKGLSQRDLASEIHISREALSKYELDQRGISPELTATATQKLDDVQLYFSSWREVGGDVSIPFLNGANVDLHPSSMVFLVKQETLEALNSVEELPWHMPADKVSKEIVERTIFELLDATAAMLNLVGAMCKTHEISMMKVFQKWQITVRARGLKQ